MIKFMVIKKFSIFLGFCICSITNESCSGGLGLIAVDYKHSREARTRKPGCESCELAKVWRSLEPLYISWTVCKLKIKCNIGSDGTFPFPCLYSGKESVLCLLLVSTVLPHRQWSHSLSLGETHQNTDTLPAQIAVAEGTISWFLGFRIKNVCAQRPRN